MKKLYPLLLFAAILFVVGVATIPSEPRWGFGVCIGALVLALVIVLVCLLRRSQGS